MFKQDKFRDDRQRREYARIGSAMERRLSLMFGVLIGAMWMGEVLLGNLAGTSVFRNAGDTHPGLYSLARLFASSAVGVTALCGFMVAYRTRSIVAALRVGLWSGLISGAIAFVTIASTVLLFHDALMEDPSNVREFALGAHRAASDDELSRFIYWDGFAGGANHIWLGPLLGITAGGIGAVLGKPLRRSDEVTKSALTES
jgi:hypothetical protein